MKKKVLYPSVLNLPVKNGYKMTLAGEVFAIVLTVLIIKESAWNNEIVPGFFCTVYDPEKQINPWSYRSHENIYIESLSLFHCFFLIWWRFFPVAYRLQSSV